MSRTAESAWDREYERGRYRGEPPVPFVEDILREVHTLDSFPLRGLYIGCGNGRNYAPLVAGGLDLVGLDISGTAIAQLADRMPERRDRLVHGGLDALPSERTFGVVVGIQVFQHGTRTQAHATLVDAMRRVAVGGLLCLRVNAVGTDVWPEHEVIERSADGSFTVRYLAGPKAGLSIHFFSRLEIAHLLLGWKARLPLRLRVSPRTPPAPGQWSQWEGIWRRVPHSPPERRRVFVDPSRREGLRDD
jgi:hypothetical protein